MRTKDENKRVAIREAAIAEVAAGGLAGASIARIADRARLSQGTIYLYYPTKESLIRQVYIEIKLDIGRSLMSHYDPTRSSAENIRAVWYALFHYVLNHPTRFAFTEYIAAANLFDEQREPALIDVQRQMTSIITTAINDGTLKSAPYQSLQAVLVSPISQLCRTMTITGQSIDPAVMDATFDLIWRGISNP